MKKKRKKIKLNEIKLISTRIKCIIIINAIHLHVQGNKVCAVL